MKSTLKPCLKAVSHQTAQCQKISFSHPSVLEQTSKGVWQSDEDTYASGYLIPSFTHPVSVLFIF